MAVFRTPVVGGPFDGCVFELADDLAADQIVDVLQHKTHPANEPSVARYRHEVTKTPGQKTKYRLVFLKSHREKPYQFLTCHYTIYEWLVGDESERTFRSE